MATPLTIDFEIHGTNVNDTVLHLYYAWRQLRQNQYDTEVGYYRLSKEPLPGYRYDALVGGTAPPLPNYTFCIDAIMYSAESEQMPGEEKKGAIVFQLSRKNPSTVVAEATLETPVVADAYSELLRAMAKFGSEKTRSTLLNPAFQQRLSELVTKNEMDAWDGLCSLAKEPEPGQQEQDKHGDSGHYSYAPDKRRDIVKEYWKGKHAGKITNQDAWARTNHNISGKTLKRYRDEFPEVAEEVSKELGLA